MNTICGKREYTVIGSWSALHYVPHFAGPSQLTLAGKECGTGSLQSGRLLEPGPYACRFHVAPHVFSIGFRALETRHDVATNMRQLQL